MQPPEIPKVSMPDLGDLDTLTKQLIVVLLGGGDSVLNPKSRLQLRTFIRLIDKAIGEYKDARECLLEEVALEVNYNKMDAEVIFSFSFTDNIENCITSARRLLRMIEKFKRNEPHLISKETSRLVASLGREITALRDVIEHIDDKIHNGEIGPGEPVLLNVSPGKDSVSIGSKYLTLDQLGAALRKMHHLGQSLLDATPRSS